MFRVSWLFLLASLIVSVAAPAPSAAAEPTLKVRVMIFSGLPDPTYVLKNEGIVRARPFLEKASRSMRQAEEEEEGDTIIPAILGYKGVLVENPAGVQGLPKRFVVFQGQIEGLGKKQILFADKGRSLENFLLREAVRQGVINEKTLRRLKKEACQSDDEKGHRRLKDEDCLPDDEKTRRRPGPGEESSDDDE